jgi:hypothetical protein
MNNLFDRTVLFDSNGNSNAVNSATLSESPANFQFIKVFCYQGGKTEIFEFNVPSFPYNATLMYPAGISNCWSAFVRMNVTTSSISITAKKQFKVGTITDTTVAYSNASHSSPATDKWIVKVLGINRIQ